jgi:hypothetical protein
MKPLIYLKETSVLSGRYTWRSCGKSQRIEVFEWQCLVYMETRGLHNGGETIYPYARPYI